MTDIDPGTDGEDRDPAWLALRNNDTWQEYSPSREFRSNPVIVNPRHTLEESLAWIRRFDRSYRNE